MYLQDKGFFILNSIEKNEYNVMSFLSIISNISKLSKYWHPLSHLPFFPTGTLRVLTGDQYPNFEIRQKLSFNQLSFFVSGKLHPELNGNRSTNDFE